MPLDFVKRGVTPRRGNDVMLDGITAGLRTAKKHSLLLGHLSASNHGSMHTLGLGLVNHASIVTAMPRRGGPCTARPASYFFVKKPANVL